MKKLFGVLAVLAFFFMLGTIGAMECDMISLGAGVARCVVCLICFGVFTDLAGGFDYG